MLYRVWVCSTAAAALLAFSSFAFAQAIPSEDNLMRLPGSSAQDTAATGLATMQGSITGSVNGGDNGPVNGAKIEIRNIQNGSTVAYGYTGIGGTFELSNLPQGNYEVIATSGLSQTHEQVRIDGSPVQLTLRLPHAGAARTVGGQQTVSVQQLHVPSKAQDALQKAQEYFNKGHLDQAREQVAKALSIAPTYSDAIALRGIMALQVGDTESASNDLQKAIQMDNNNAMAYVAMASIYNLKERFDDALRELQRAESLNPTLWQTHFELSKTHFGKHDYAMALHEANRAQSLIGRSFGPLHVLKGEILLGLNAFSGAVGEFQKFLQEEKDNPAIPSVQKLMEHAELSAKEQKQQ